MYIGEVDENNVPHGYGLRITNDSSLYQGYSFKGYANGNGRLIYITPDGRGGVTTAFYEGEFDQDKPNGPGFEALGQLMDYTGFWMNGVKSGQGVQSSYDKTVSYEGMFKDGLRHGLGRLEVLG